MQQVMIFQLGDEFYGLDISKIRELVEFVPLTPVPKAPAWVEGILNNHGRIATVLNLSTFFDLPQGGEKSLKRIAVIDDPLTDIGILVEDPLEMISEWELKADIAGDSGFVKNKYIARVLVSRERVINVLDIGKLTGDLDSYFI